MNEEQEVRYSRHILLKDLGYEGQDKIANSHVLVIGAGGLGSPASMYLASGGFGKLTLVDNDQVELTNLQRQILHSTDRIGKNKAESGKQTLTGINPTIDIVTITDRMDETSLPELVRTADVVLDCTDNFKTRLIVNRACMAAGVPLVSGAVVQFDGQISVYDPRRDDSPCYACLFSEDQHFEDLKAAQVGVFAPLVGIIGTMQAAEALKLAAGIGTSLAGSLLLLDALTMEWTRIGIDRNPDCPVCSARNKLKQAV
ncbi:HesA/MoeB/ThiF family protein [Oxalobacter formigenes]|uniref:Molybdopterin biosynthesis protein MoeB n=1 Tax=Oxalobacter formigenes OXCC13 TaxID=556269 RepID=C3XBT3_OXAFO|nr:HesA/MoeB/ThiF family protein [Oxalobacter formigenes]ARQ45172.1 Molybdopterin-synthase adenylyltransferase [Oxalobacter formigenes]ARQ77475.1 molybdopterin biosynthesis protein MoeB [Oxalobacter formigenes OXCC13]EEO30659.1 molybdopterin biosynthesis protein MoeB [Oxalobacter formigenes OXCC13]MCZ4062368.1 HesA/MoeB/ThiF family protein [Oxalobacter formigenes]QDX33987.1 HesA/MoeB/ThiF family protein [Oxalobacter formigenes]